MGTNLIAELVPVALVAEVVAAAKADPKFEAAFLESPQVAYRAKFGKELLPGETVEITKRENGSVLFFIPRMGEGVVV